MLPHLPCMDPIETIGLLCKRNANKLNARFSTSTLVVSSKVRFKVREESPGMSSDNLLDERAIFFDEAPDYLEQFIKIHLQNICTRLSVYKSSSLSGARLDDMLPHLAATASLDSWSGIPNCLAFFF